MMAKRDAGTDALVTQLRTTVQQEVLAELRPALQKIREGLNELERLGGGAPEAPRKRLGRPPKSGTATPTRRKRKILPRGAMRDAVVAVMGKAGKPMRLVELRDELLARPEFAGRKKETFSSQIQAQLKKMPEVSRTGEGLYSYSAAKK